MGQEGNTLGKNVRVTVKGTRTHENNDQEVIELLSPGTCHYKGNQYYILYKESSFAGMEDCTTTLRTDGKTVTIIRSGSVNSRQVFEEGKAHRSVYQTSFGCLDITVLPRRVDVDLTEQGGSIKLEYELELNDSKIGTNVLEIVVENT
ncbi:DUF1934 domain-containing protein [Desulforamulus ruminis]|uniref:DUF1934 domain-containing protein n=1 Tax=Desulforamulus ruminis (strain ATCC 23193 / DSM 2154 / NCIMB 8452 / DL) TaxID=696281 RepID=F6DP92_DESRL|nr:DUF1934 domain-containing protein [Desulforamulus ruminis]AEG61921.1 Domain of unknown function DUF1934 [Desulforamulus ruminis DSM 2154]